MKGMKAWWQSRGVWGGAITLAAGLAGLFGFDVSADLQAELVDHMVEIVALVGGVFALIGRLRATKKIA